MKINYRQAAKTAPNGISRYALRNRVLKGMTLEEATTLPVTRNYRSSPETAFGQTLSLTDWAKFFGLSVATVSLAAKAARARGMTFEEEVERRGWRVSQAAGIASQEAAALIKGGWPVPESLNQLEEMGFGSPWV